MSKWAQVCLITQVCVVIASLSFPLCLSLSLSLSLSVVLSLGPPLLEALRLSMSQVPSILYPPPESHGSAATHPPP